MVRIAVDVERSGLNKGAFKKRNSLSVSKVEWLRVVCVQ